MTPPRKAGVVLGAVLAFTTDCGAQQAHVLRDEVRAWARAFARHDAMSVEWRVKFESLDAQRRSRGVWIVMNWATIYRWPDCYLKRTEFVDVSATGDFSVEELDGIRRGAKATINDRKAISPQGGMARVSDINGVWYENVPDYGSLRVRALEVAEDSPYLIARWFLDVGDSCADGKLSATGEGAVRAEFDSERCSFELARYPNGTLVLKSFDRWNPERKDSPSRWTFGDWSLVAKDLPPVPRSRALWLRDQVSGEMKEVRIDHLNACEVIPRPEDDRFRLDLSNVRVVDKNTGEVRDAEGNIRGRVRVQGSVSAIGQWSILFGSLGAGLGVAGGLLWWRQRRAT